jgi:hypothetical protein
MMTCQNLDNDYFTTRAFEAERGLTLSIRAAPRMH